MGENLAMVEQQTTQSETAAAAVAPIAAAQALSAPPVVPAAKAPEYVTLGTLYKVVFLVAILSSFLAVFAYDRIFATKIAVFDLQDYLTKLRTDAVDNKLTPEQYKARLDRLESTVMSVPNNTIIVTGDVILGKNAKRLNVPAE
jgi:hypothetical protein